MNTISLIITTYNRSILLKRAIESVYNLAFDEIILVNDGSNNEHSKEVEQLLLNYPKIIYVKKHINQGLAEARNTGLRISNSKWVTFLDDDDYYFNNPIESLKQFITDNPNADIIHFKIRCQRGKAQLDWGYETFTLEELIDNNRLSGCSLIKKSSWEQLDGYRNIPYEDWEFWIRAKKEQMNFVYFPEIFYLRDIQKEGLQSQMENNFKDIEWKHKYVYGHIIPRQFNKDIGIGISTFLRDESLFRLIDSIIKYLPEFKMYIADQAKPNEKKQELYNRLKALGHSITYLPYDCGISATRKYLKEVCQEQYLVYMEDDFVATEKTNLYKLQTILEENPNIGVVGGNLQGYSKTGAYSFYLDRMDDKICYIPLDYLIEKNLCQWKYTSKGIQFLMADIVSDFTMWRKEVPNIFDENVKVCEHTDVYMLIKTKTNYKVAFTSDTEINHVHSSENEAYNLLRARREDVIYLYKYWDVKDFYQFTKPLLKSLEKPKPIAKKEKVIVESTVVEIKPLEILAPKIETFKKVDIPILPPKIEETPKVIEEPLIKTILLEFIGILKNHNTPYCLLKTTCLDTIVFKELKQDMSNIYIGTHVNKTILDECLLKGFIYNNNCFIKNNINIYIEQLPKSTKKETIYDKQVIVPFPVVKYLQLLYKDNIIVNWNKGIAEITLK